MQAVPTRVLQSALSLIILSVPSLDIIFIHSPTPAAIDLPPSVVPGLRAFSD